MSTNPIAVYKEMTGFINKGRAAEKMLLSTAWRTSGEQKAQEVVILSVCINTRWKGKAKRDRLFSVTSNDRKRENGHILKPRIFSMNIRNLFTV